MSVATNAVQQSQQNIVLGKSRKEEKIMEETLTYEELQDLRMEQQEQM